MAVLVTGGAGFIGSHIVDRLLAETTGEVVVLDDFNDYYDPFRKHANLTSAACCDRFHLVQGSFSDDQLLEQVFGNYAITAVLHLGGYPGVTPSLAQPQRYFDTNVAGTFRLLEASSRAKVQRFMFASSSTVYGRGATAPFREDAPLGAPLSPYGASKQMAETRVAMYHDVYGLPTIRLRLFNVYGPRMRPDLAMAVFARRILSGETLRLFGDGTIRRDFTHVDDVCRGILAALAAPATVGQAINLGHDQPVEIREVIRLIESAAGRKAKIEMHPPRTEDMPLTHADITKARELLGYQPAISLEHGVADYVRWLQSQPNTS
jgi:UDP-glucuronate 4-epimerase